MSAPSMVRPEAGRLHDHVAAVLGKHWHGTDAVVLTDDFDRCLDLVGELRACGARVRAVVTRSAAVSGAPPVGHVWTADRLAPGLTRPGFEAMLADPPAELLRWLDDLDPGRRWIALGTPRTGISAIGGRTVHGWRRPAWAAIEDKTTIDALWRKADVPAPDHVLVDADDLVHQTWPEDLAGGAGVILAADSTQGHVGDALGLRWAPTPDSFAGAAKSIATAAQRVRIASFVDGVPCSVLGMVLPDGVAIFSPIEIVTLGDPAEGTLVFCGSSTRWRPPRDAVAEIRAAARRAADVLAGSAGYRGIFSVDGLLTDDGFVATELNPRHASGLGLRAALPGFPVYLMNRAVQERVAGLPGITAVELEDLVRDCVAAAPSLSLTVPVSGVADGPGELVVDGSRIRFTARGDSVRLLSVEPAAPDGRAGPACAVLARAFGHPGARSFPLGVPARGVTA